MTDLTDPHIQQATAAARELRAQLHEPLECPLAADLLALTEHELGIPVCIMPMPDGVAGAYLKKRGRCFIFIQSTDYPTRQRFTLAHELGHHRLRHRGRVESGSEVGYESDDPNEQQANFFASEFLMPERAAGAWLAENAAGGVLTIATVVRMADDFHVSPPAMLYRLSKGAFGLSRADLQELWDDVKAKIHVKLAEQKEIGHGCDQMSAHYDRADEGRGAPRLPAVLESNARAARAVGLITEERLGEVLRQA